MKHIPNIFTLLNLFFGCIAITFIMQNGLSVSRIASDDLVVILPERIHLASLFIGIAALVDFFDGFLARLLKADSAMGKQLDSLADVVSFGVAPGLIVYQFLRLAFASQPDGLDVSLVWLLPAFIIPCAGAYRLARFNLDTRQTQGFRGVPIPAAGLLIASFPLIYWYADSQMATNLLLNQWFWYAVIAVVSYLMISTLPMMALKFTDFTLKNNWPKLLLLVLAVVSAVIWGWLAVPVVFVCYVALSLFFAKATV